MDNDNNLEAARMRARMTSAFFGREMSGIGRLWDVITMSILLSTIVIGGGIVLVSIGIAILVGAM
jgi:hypothetical protein